MKKSLLISIFLLSCTTAKKMTDSSHSSSMNFPEFDKEGHRGCRGLMPENTIPAMLKALELGVTTLEMDAHITNDNQVVISHDPYFNHDITTKPDGTYISVAEEKNYVLYKMQYDEIKKFDVGLKPYSRFPQQQKLAVYKPLLSELIDSVEQYCRSHKRALPFYNIETKSLAATDHIYHPAPEEFVRLLMNVISSKKIAERAIIQSFDIRTLQIVYQKYPSLKTSLLIEGYDNRGLDVQLKELGFIPTIYSPEYSLVNETLLKKCHEQNSKVIPWTANDKITIERLRTMGVDGIISDYPNLFE